MQERFVDVSTDAEKKQENQFSAWLRGEGIPFVNEEASAVYRQKVSLIKNAIQIKKMSARIPICPSAGTFSGNPLTLSTGAATLKYLQENGDIYPDMMAKGKFLRNGFNEYCSSNGYPFCMTGIGSIFQIHAKAELPRIPRDLLGQDEDALGELQLYFRLNNILPPTPRRILKKC